tara:strand:+ start:1484 stop:1783 length:300 start_codon:yes stop_codon:yes gene_type:complete
MNIFLSCPPVYHLPGTWTECKEPLIHHLNLAPGPAFAVFMGLLVVALMIWGIYMTFGSGGKDLRDEIAEHSKMHELGIAHSHKEGSIRKLRNDSTENPS